MKTSIFTLLAASLCSLNLIAQQKTTAIQSRLRAEAYWKLDGVSGTLYKVTSDTLTYKVGNSWNAILNDWKFDTKVWGHPSYKDKAGRTTNTFNAQSQVSEQLTELISGNTYTPKERYLYTYTAQGNIASQEYQLHQSNAWQPNFKLTNSYDAKGRLTEKIEIEGWSSGTYVNDSRTEITYDTNDRIAIETGYRWDSSLSQWVNEHLDIHTYTNNLHTSILREWYINGRFEKIALTSFYYDSSGKMTGQTIQKYVGATLNNVHRHTYTYDAAGNRTSDLWEYVYSNGVYENFTFNTTTYNNFNQPLVETYKFWEQSTSTFEYRAGSPGEKYYYYDLINTDVKNTGVQIGGINIYPIPANNTLTLDLNWNETQPATVMLFDMTGKLAGQWTTPSAKQHTQMLDISNIPSGTYMLKVMGTKGVLSQQVNIVK